MTGLENRIAHLEQGQKDLDQGQKDLEKGQKNIISLLERHFDLPQELNHI